MNGLLDVDAELASLEARRRELCGQREETRRQLTDRLQQARQRLYEAHREQDKPINVGDDPEVADLSRRFNAALDRARAADRERRENIPLANMSNPATVTAAGQKILEMEKHCQELAEEACRLDRVYSEAVSRVHKRMAGEKTQRDAAAIAAAEEEVRSAEDELRRMGFATR